MNSFFEGSFTDTLWCLNAYSVFEVKAFLNRLMLLLLISCWNQQYRFMMLAVMYSYMFFGKGLFPARWVDPHELPGPILYSGKHFRCETTTTNQIH